ncbi:hypothetical protein [Roseibium sp. Sym1]|uniref:hypothetical protein n=1 Tax=Roseibium sp. Sym1 TaxID=3016006 RepID=UPI0022B43384|nr:hypothetical protein [Roseibium sp. Sym1]
MQTVVDALAAFWDKQRLVERMTEPPVDVIGSKEHDTMLLRCFSTLLNSGSLETMIQTLRDSISLHERFYSDRGDRKVHTQEYMAAWLDFINVQKKWLKELSAQLESTTSSEQRIKC